VDFSDALRLARQGKKIRRRFYAELNGKVGESVELVQPVLPDGRPVMPMLLCNKPDGVMTLFAGAQWDLLANDWEVVE
jgi:hypothetical protein